MKNTILISCPIDSKSGYGYHSRDIVKSIFNLYRNTYDIKIAITTWGTTPNGALNKNIPEDKEIIDNILTVQLPKRPEIYITIAVPNEFQQVGQYLNIGITAGIETTIASQAWIEGCNKMDLILVPSEHAKTTFLKTGYEKRDANTQRLIETIKLTKPIEVVFEGVDQNIFTTLPQGINTKLIKSIDDIPNDFLFLATGMWLPGELGEDRKNMSGLIKTFLETFQYVDNKPALLLKVSCGNYSRIDYHNILKKITKIQKLINSDNLPDIYIVHGDLSDTELNDLYNHNKVKAFVSFTKGEGYGRPLAEFSTTGKPIIASKWSGQLDFLSPKHCTLLPGTLTNVHPSSAWKDVILTESQWFTVDYVEASKILMDVYKDYDKYKKKSEYQKTLIEKFSLKNMEIKLDEILKDKFDKVPKMLDLNLPTLKRL